VSVAEGGVLTVPMAVAGTGVTAFDTLDPATRLTPGVVRGGGFGQRSVRWW
jgi:hypothetical protein